LLIGHRRAHHSRPDRQSRCDQRSTQSQFELSSRNHFESSMLSLQNADRPES